MAILLPPAFGTTVERSVWPAQTALPKAEGLRAADKEKEHTELPENETNFCTVLAASSISLAGVTPTYCKAI